MRTIKQIADELGIDKQKVYRYIKRNNILDVLQEAGVMYYHDTDVDSIIAHFSQEKVHQEVHQSDTVEAIIFMLKKELEIKNEQIRELNARLAESNAALVAAQQSAQMAQVLHAGTMQKQLTDGETADTTPPTLWGRLFGKRK